MNHPIATIRFLIPEEGGTLTKERHWYHVPRTGDAIRLDAPPNASDLFFVCGDVTWCEDHVEIWVHPL